MKRLLLFIFLLTVLRSQPAPTANFVPYRLYFSEKTDAQITTLGTPSSGYGFVYEKDDNLLYFKDDSGIEYTLSSITGDALFMATNTSGFILRADGTDYSPVSFVNSSDLAGFISDEVGTIYLVYSDSPAFTTSILPAVAGATDIGTASLEWGDIYQGDDKKHYFGLDQDWWMEYDEDGNDHMIFAGADINMSGKYFVDEQSQVNSSGVYYNLDGDGDYIEVADNADINMNTNDFSVDLHIRPQNVTDTAKRLMSKTDGTTGFEIVINEDDLQVAILDNVANVTLTNLATAIFSAKTWVYISITFDRDGNIQAHKNGVPVGTPISCTATATIANGSVLRIGTETGGTTNEFTGQIDKARIWNRLETLAEVIKYQTESISFDFQGASQTERITVQNNRDFSASNIGNWVINTDGSGTFAYNTDAIGGADNKQALLTAAGDENWLEGSLPTTNATTLTVGKSYRITAKAYVTAASVQKTIEIGIGSIDVDNVRTPYTLAGDTWTIISHEFKVTGTDVTGRYTVGWVSSPSFGDKCYFDDISIIDIGIVVELDGSTMTASKWYDKQNDLDGTVNGPGLNNQIAALVITDYLDVTGTMVFSGDDVTYTALTGAALNFVLEADASEDNADTWKFLIADGDLFSLQTFAGGSYADALTIVGSTKLATFAGSITLTGANTLQTSTGQLDIKTAAGNGDIVLTPHGTGDIILDGHWNFNANALTSLTDNNTTITAYTGKAVVVESVTFDGGAVGSITTLSMNSQLTNSLADGTAPFVITSTTLNTNFNADLLDGEHASAFQDAHASLLSIAGLTETNGGMLYGTADDAYAWLAAGAEGTLLMGNGVGAPSFLAAGTAGYALLANGAADPVWTQLDSDDLLDVGDIGMLDENEAQTGYWTSSFTNGITATDPGVQGDNVITTELFEVSVVGTAGDAVTLSPAVGGKHVYIINNGANSLEIWPTSGDDAGAGVDTAINLASGATLHLAAYNGTTWETF